jgi:hypothetical protein
MFSRGAQLNRYLLLSLAPPACATAAVADAPREVQYGNAPSWILAPPAATAAKPSEAAFRIVYQDTEERLVPGGVESYSAYRMKVLKPEALSLGNVTMIWSPSGGTATAHYVRIIRDGTTIDILKQSKFKVLERETGLEQSVLDGNLTALLQVPGLQVGDELEFAGTVVRSEPAFGTHAAGMAQMPVGGFPGAFRYRLLWPQGKALTLRLAKDLPTVAPAQSGGFKSLLVEMRDPPASLNVEGAPPRYNLHRTIQYSDYADWTDLSKQMWPLYERASQLQANSPLREEVKKIAAASADPVERTQAALRLVEDQIRYVFVGLDGGNYIPASADETWQRRFGDCKAKTVVLLALLRELGIKADPMLVNSKGGDGINERLPNPGLFDHVVVRANVAGKDVWLDGARMGDRYLDMLPPNPFEWALPVTAAGAKLISIPTATSAFPQFITVVDIDASTGFGKDAVWTAKHVLRGDEAFQIVTTLSTVSPADADQMVRAYWRQQANWIEPQQVSWNYDQRHAAVILSIKGTGNVDWDVDDKGTHSYTIPGAGFYAPDKMVRPADQDQTAAWAVEYPRFRCWATTIHLPPPTAKFHWTYSAKAVNRRLAGATYWRTAGLSGNVIRTVMSRQSFSREIPAAEAKLVNAQITSFDNYMSSVSESADAETPASKQLPFTDEPDWTGNPAVCSPPSK